MILLIKKIKEQLKKFVSKIDYEEYKQKQMFVFDNLKILCPPCSPLRISSSDMQKINFSEKTKHKIKY